MIYAFMFNALVSLGLIAAILWELHKGREERQDLKDRLMAICYPVAQIQVQSQNRTPGTVKYSGEEPYSAKLEKNHADATT